jgi:DNA-binding MarR family transcriptional regulator
MWRWCCPVRESDGDLAELDRTFEELRRRWRVRLRRATREALGDAVGLRAFPLLEQLVERGPLSPTELAQRLELRTSTIAAHIDRLEELGWAERSGQGRKGVQVSATAQGAVAHGRYLELRRRMLSELVAPMGGRDVRELGRLLQELLRGLLPEAGER